ncbi:MAG: hypothetical protein ACOZEN_16220 [Thermodesulfobacteriota bacterium]
MKLRRYQAYLLIVLGLFLSALAHFTGFLNVGGGRAGYLAVESTPPGADWYIDLQWGLTESHFHVLYHGIGPSIENARKADILLLGDSRALLGFDWRQIEAFSKDHGVRIFNLAIDGGTGWEFPLALMKRHGIRPKAVILTVPSFISNPVFPAAREAMDSSLLTSFKYVLSGETIWRLKNSIAMVSPRLLTWFYPRHSFHSTYRSTVHGNWYRDNWIDDPRYPVRAAGEPCGKEPPLPAEFMDTLSGWGTTVILGDIPGDNWCPADAARLAARMGAESVTVSDKGLHTYDHGHLTRDSSELFTRRFLDALTRTQAFGRIARKPG